ncbi:MAG: polynucleotide adenylyltransferase PcnB [Gammaproteobacteria bacterium]|uniref:Polynucleotide adenylyltransferase PcnB n=1 Tax=SAR86 cluster bacterium TaxID=2030880 RepID=A0A520MNH0_9GAMM|nr:MAG: poly(A) polymerase [Gammaproteobacteria bacterium TMED242]RZO22759.1 MAG: polynucleotide adenylyltransferase PcnB [SAR86 cluster bacterium]
MIDNKKISKFAISVVDDLQKNNFQAYLVGGCVRDALSGIEPKDFDIATNATPEQVRKIFKASRIIGKRFRLVHVFNRSELLEVATFRSGDNDKNDPDNLITDSSGKIIRDNIWGTLEQDCKRRDFTVNALYYCPISKKIEDYNNGLRHIHKKIIVSIGDPQRRFEEDPVRSLRAIRFSNKLNFKIDNPIKDAIYDKGHLLSNISNARMFDEFCKIFLNGMGEKNFIKLCSFNLNKYLIISRPEKNDFSNDVILQALKNTDDRVKNQQSITPGFLMAALLWPTLLEKCSKDGEINIRKFFRSMDGVLRNQQKLTAVPRKFSSYIKDIWVLQLKLHSRIGSQPYKTLRHPRFRAAYDFLLVRERAANDKNGLGKWWTDFQKNDDSLRGSIIAQMKEKNDEESSKKFGFYNELR